MTKLYNILIGFLVVIAIGCSTNKPSVYGPPDLVASGHHLKRAIPDCWRANGVADVKFKYNVAVKKEAATGMYGSKYIFLYDGQRVGGVTLTRCKGSADIIIAADPNNGAYNESTYRHEWCHALDFQGPCKGGHPDDYKKGGCCPDWPYLTKAMSGINNVCLQAVLDDESVLFIEVPVPDDVDGLDLTLSKIQNPVWIKGLMLKLGLLDDLEINVLNVFSTY